MTGLCFSSLAMLISLFLDLALQRRQQQVLMGMAQMCCSIPRLIRVTIGKCQAVLMGIIMIWGTAHYWCKDRNGHFAPESDADGRRCDRADRGELTVEASVGSMHKVPED